jgi:prepilin signal peptidase PulO-like enzyme (type II secretory pathway)
MVVLIFCVGLAIGSFLQVAYYRYSPSQSLSEYLFAISVPRSSCPNCYHKLCAWQLIPVLSWLALKRRCYFCQHKIAFCYPLFELAIAGLFLIIYLDKGLNYQSGLLMLLVAVFLVFARIDFNYLLLPDFFTQPLMWGGLMVAYFDLTLLTIADALTGIFCGYLMLKLPAMFYFCMTKRVGLGGGDIKLSAALGAWVPYQLMPILLVTASLLGIFYFVLVKLFLKKQVDNLIAFGPFLLLSGYLLIYLG